MVFSSQTVLLQSLRAQLFTWTFGGRVVGQHPQVCSGAGVPSSPTCGDRAWRPRCEGRHSHSQVVSQASGEDTVRNWTWQLRPLLLSNDDLLHGLVLGHASDAEGARIGPHKATALFGTTTVPPFLGHLGREEPREPNTLFLKALNSQSESWSSSSMFLIYWF